QEEYEEAVNQPIVIKRGLGTPAGGYAIHGEYAAELARQLLYSVYQDNIYSRGLNVYTTIDSKKQEAAYKAVRDGVLAYTRRTRFTGLEATISIADEIENDAQALDNLLDDLQDEYPDNVDLLTGLVRSASPDKVVVARTS